MNTVLENWNNFLGSQMYTLYCEGDIKGTSVCYTWHACNSSVSRAYMFVCQVEEIAILM
jgi:hypothetical protein